MSTLKLDFEQRLAAERLLAAMAEDDEQAAHIAQSLVMAEAELERLRAAERRAEELREAATKYVIAKKAHDALGEKPYSRARERTAQDLWREVEEHFDALDAALDPPPLKVGDRVVYTDEAQTKGTVLRVCDDSPLVYILWDDDLLSRAGDAERPSDLRRVEKEKP